MFNRKSPIRPRMFKFANRLKERLGERFREQPEGFLAPEALEEADKAITALCADCPAEIAKNLDMLTAQWSQMRDMPAGAERKIISDQMFLTAHEIKDVGSICGYDLIAYFAESLRDYVEKTDLNMKAQQVIIQAHLDAMVTVHRADVKKDAGPQAEELKRMVRKAIEKYS